MSGIFNFLNYIVLVILLVVAGVVGFQHFRKKKDVRKLSDKGESSKNPFYETEYVQDFLDFDKIAHNMIIRENGAKFTMVINCSGINFDLMSEHERVMVEEAFIELLNFIQFPIQIYVQTRKVDLKDSLKAYAEKVNAIENEMRLIMDEYNSLKAQGVEDPEQLGILEYEIQRKQNLYEYAQDLRKHIERLSINSNVLQYKYYIVITYHIEELGLMTNFSESEILEMAYNELYTRCHSIIGALMGCDIDASILDSNGLAELLYMAFNRDDAELYRLKDNMEAGFYRLYSTTENVLNIQHNLSDYIENDSEKPLVLLTDNYELDELSKEYLMESVRESSNV